MAGGLAANPSYTSSLAAAGGGGGGGGGMSPPVANKAIAAGQVGGGPPRFLIFIYSIDSLHVLSSAIYIYIYICVSPVYILISTTCLSSFSFGGSPFPFFFFLPKSNLANLLLFSKTHNALHRSHPCRPQAGNAVDAVEQALKVVLLGLCHGEEVGMIARLIDQV